MRERGEEQRRERGWRRGDGEDEALGKREGEVMKYNGAQKRGRAEVEVDGGWGVVVG